MKQDLNKAGDLLDKLATFTFRYLDYIGLYIILAPMFSVSYTDYRVFCVVGAVIVFSAISADGVRLFSFLKKDKQEEGKKTEPESTDPEKTSSLSQKPNGQLWLHELNSKFTVKSDDVKGLNFPNLGEIRVQKISQTEILIFTKDYRAIRLAKEEINQLYTCLIESECTFFREGTYDVEITIKKQQKKQ